MQIHFTQSDFHLSLQHNCIYYFPSRTDRQLNREMAKVVGRWKCHWLVCEIQKFDFQFLYVEEETMDELFNFNPTNAELEEAYGRLLLRELLGDENGGVLVARPFPQPADPDEPDGQNGLMVATQLNAACASTFKELDGFALEVAKLNFQRIIGMEYRQYRAQLDFIESSNSMAFGGGRGMQMITIGSSSYNSQPKFQRQTELKIRETIAKMGTKSQTASMEEIKQWIKEMNDEVNNEGKIAQKKTVFMDYDDNDKYSYEIIVENPNGTPIRCEFDRGPVAKTLYVFLLRHPKGVHIKDLSNNIMELYRIYNMFNGHLNCYDASDAIDNLCDNNKGVIRITCTDIKKTMEHIFASGIAPWYCVENRKSILRIPIENDYVDLREFGFEILK